MIYLASPYSHPDPEIEAARAEAALLYTAEQMELGFVIFSPIAYGRQFHARGLRAGDANSWFAFNYHMLYHSTAMHVLKLAGWDESVGISHELDFAIRAQVPITYIEVSDENI